MAQLVKELVLSLLRLGFNPWSGNFHVPQAWPGKKKKRLGETSFSQARTKSETQSHLHSFLLPSSSPTHTVTELTKGSF